MTSLADEGVDRPIVARLREDGHTVRAVAEMEPGLPDSTDLALSRERGAVLVTTDKDFSEPVFRQRLGAVSVVLSRLAGVQAERKAELVSLAVREHEELLIGAFSVVTAASACIRAGG